MIIYLSKRLAAAAGILLVICAVTFVIFYVVPSDPALQACGKTCTPERVAEVRAQMGLPAAERCHSAHRASNWAWAMPRHSD